MKRRLSKLSLHRDTVQQLDRKEALEAIAGGISRRCEWSGYQTCGTCAATCGTNLC